MPDPNSDGKMTLKDYLQLFNSFSPESTIQQAVGVGKLEASDQGDVVAQKSGYPNLASMDIAERVKQRQVVDQLRGEQQKDRQGRMLLEGAQAGQFDPTMAGSAHEALAQYYKLLGIQPPAPKTDAVTERMKQKRK